MLRKKFNESLTARIFFITALMLFCAAAITFCLIAWATPVTYTAVVNDDLSRQTDALVGKLAETNLDDCAPLLDEFIHSSGADVILTGNDGQIINTGSQFAVQPLYRDSAPPAGNAFKSGEAVTWAADTASSGDEVTVTMSEQDAITADVRFADEDELYFLCVTPRIQAENLAVRALLQMVPWLFLVLLAFSLLCAFVYSRYITRPVVRLSGIAERMAELDFSWECGGKRKDEIGRLGQSLDRLSGRLSSALKELETANRALQKEVAQERELDRQRMAFFSAASPELKTPVTILKGQLSGMLEGIGVYRNRDKYLLRSLQTAGRMEKLIQEMLSISRMESGQTAVHQKPLDLSLLLRQQIELDRELPEQRGQRLILRLTPDTVVTGDARLLGKAAGNLLSNAALYSPNGAEIRVWCGTKQGVPCFSIENTGVHIRSEALEHLFEPFYREEISRSRKTGGSGLGLYLVQMILERHGAFCTIENTADGVQAAVRFPNQT